MVRAGESDFRVVDAEGRHLLEEGDGVGDGDFEVWLLHAIAEAGVEEFGGAGLGVHAFLLCCGDAGAGESLRGAVGARN